MIRTRKTSAQDVFASFGPFSVGGGFIGFDLDLTTTAVGVDTSGTNQLGVTLQDPTTVPQGRRVLVQDIGGNASANNIPISTNGSATIHGDVTIADDYGAREYMTNGIDWFLCGSVP